MSSGFISGGTTDAPIERDAEWLKAQQELEAARREKAERGKQAEGKTLYEVLQQNKAAKQDAFEESIKLRNQFRALDDDEVDFLDSIVESERAKEDAVRKETREQLEAFRQQQQQAAAEATHAEDFAEDQGVDAAASAKGRQWAVSGKKRRRDVEKDLLKGVKLRKASASEPKPQSVLGIDGPPARREKLDEAGSVASTTTIAPTVSEQAAKSEPASSKAVTTTPSVLGLGAYDSDSD